MRISAAGYSSNRAKYAQTQRFAPPSMSGISFGQKFPVSPEELARTPKVLKREINKLMALKSFEERMKGLNNIYEKISNYIQGEFARIVNGGVLKTTKSNDGYVIMDLANGCKVQAPPTFDYRSGALPAQGRIFKNGKLQLLVVGDFHVGNFGTSSINISHKPDYSQIISGTIKDGAYEEVVSLKRNHDLLTAAYPKQEKGGAKEEVVERVYKSGKRTFDTRLRGSQK